MPSEPRRRSKSPRPASQAARPDWWGCFFAQSEDALVVCDRKGCILQVNERASSRLGLASGTPLVGGPRLAPPTSAHLAELLAAPGRSQHTLHGAGVTLADGSTLITELRLLPLDEACWLLTIPQAAQTWRMEAQTQRLLAAIDSTPDLVLLTDASFRITFVNPAFESATGYTLEEVLGHAVDSFHAPEEQAKREEYLKASGRGADWVGELVMVRRDGTRFPVEMTFSPIHAQDGEFIGAVAFQRDITSRQKIQEAFLAERTFVRSIINSLQGSLYTLDGKLRLTHFNDGWQKLPPQHGWLHLQQPPRVGQCLLDSVPEPGQRAALEKTFRLVLSEGQPQELQAVDGTGRHWQMSVFPWKHESQIRGLIYRVTDNSAFVGIQNQLFQAQKLGTLGILAAGIAHDFNNLLLAIRGNVGLVLCDGQVSPEIRERLQHVEEAAARACDLSSQLTNFSRDTEEKVTVLDFNQVIKEAAELARRVRSGLRGRVGFKLQGTETPLKVQMDGTRATQMLLNLCINAHDAMPNGGTITITNSCVDLTEAQWAKVKRHRDGQFMRCTVADTGSGIRPELLPRIFSPFFTTKEKGKGTGLGLSIVHTVATKAGGFIEVESAVGQGTAFHVYLPINAGPLTRTETELKQQITRGAGRLLVVDDLDLVLEFASNFLRLAGYQVFTANSAAAAVKLLAQQKGCIDVLFTDYSMPDKNGWQLIQEVTARWPLVRCVLASGYLDDAERTEIARQPGIRILTKPYGIAEATQVMAELTRHDPPPALPPPRP